MDNFKTRQAQVAERSVFLNRILFSSLAILLLGGLIISRLIYLMVIESDELSLRSVNNTLRTQSIPAPRGLIYDRNIEVIAENKPKFQLEMVPEQVRPTELFVYELVGRIPAGDLCLPANWNPAQPQAVVN